jgi:hypothetical protein
VDDVIVELRPMPPLWQYFSRLLTTNHDVAALPHSSHRAERRSTTRSSSDTSTSRPECHACGAGGDPRGSGRPGALRRQTLAAEGKIAACASSSSVPAAGIRVPIARAPDTSSKRAGIVFG